MNKDSHPLPSIRPAKLFAQQQADHEPLNDGDRPLESKLLDFWRWSASNLLDNTQRGIFAEWLVATALGCAGGER